MVKRMGGKVMAKIDYIEEIKRLKQAKNAVILAHYYQKPEVQDIADYLGDSLALSRIAANTKADIIVFCGVHFMAETAKILSPNKLVLLPVKKAGCSMANMIDDKSLEEYKLNHPEVKIICYVNSTAKVKALSDVCVTSGNAEKVISQFKNHKLLYVPDKNLGAYLREKYQLDMELWPGYCGIHNDINVAEVEKVKTKYPHSELIVHPECKLDIIKMADYVGSTKSLLNYVNVSDSKEFIVGTEKGIIHQMKLANPNKSFYLLSDKLSCHDMKLTSLTDVYHALLNEQYEINVEANIQVNALKALEVMFELTDR